jgi:hypothetical protein
VGEQRCDPHHPVADATGLSHYVGEGDADFEQGGIAYRALAYPG